MLGMLLAGQTISVPDAMATFFPAQDTRGAMSETTDGSPNKDFKSLSEMAWIHQNLLPTIARLGPGYQVFEPEKKRPWRHDCQSFERAEIPSS